MKRLLPGLIGSAIVGCLGIHLHAENPLYEWNTGTGNANIASNWMVDGSPPADPPDSDSILQFAREASEAYTVTFGAGAQHFHSLYFGDDNVILDFTAGTIFSLDNVSNGDQVRLGTTTATTATVTYLGGELNLERGWLTMGTASGSNVTLNIVGSIVDEGGGIMGGQNAFATLNISGGAEVIANREIQMSPSSNMGTGGAKITVSGEDSLLHILYNFQNRPLLVGRRGGGAGSTVEAIDGGRVLVGNTLDIGRDSGGIGHVLVSGSGSTLESNRQTQIGGVGTGTVLVEDGGVANIGIDPRISAGGDLIGTASTIIGASNNGTGVLTVTGAGSQWIDYYGHYIGGNTTDAGGTGTTWVRAGAELRVAEENREQIDDDIDYLRVYEQGTLNLDLGSVTVQGSGLLADNGSQIRGQGNITASGVVSGSMELGNFTGAEDSFLGSESGTINWTGDLTLTSDSLLGLSITNATDHDQLILTGSLVADGGVLEIFFNELVNPTPANPIQLISWTETSSVNFSSIDFLGVEQDDLEVLINSDGLSVIPEPATITLLSGLGLIALILTRQRRK